ncbi:type II toxin-antitoxin system HicA family toxin [Chamaesiphon sp. OTE_20_metabat_361]|uniref:type II toxin-antitoxin system HicA family toxin n=1 Tax=Chamaesiphon sp. OTE_20_metabat_361 TaxID=2964689 RepID=UPI00286ACB92|nr:type II toxin-antitoxin system HicA family toxin [Chamaesiphon sp. OTE_20_metabat_361]
MGKLEKLIELFLRQPPEVRFADVLDLLEAFGYTEQRSKGSHHTFSDPDGQTIVIPKVSDQKVKRVYVKRIIELLDLNSNLTASNLELDTVVVELEPEENSND